MEWTFRPLNKETFEDFARFHQRPEARGCHCMYWQYPGDNRAWQLRTAEENCADKRSLVETQRTNGVLAYESSEVVGALQFEERQTLSKLTARMPYKQLPAGAGIFAIGCVLVRADRRRSGVARGLLRETIRVLRASGAKALEGFPRRSEELTDEELWTGPEGLFVGEGFELVRDQLQYPVYRLAL